LKNHIGALPINKKGDGTPSYRRPYLYPYINSLSTIFLARSRILFILLSYFIFSLIEGVMGNVAVLFSNLLMGLVIGLVFAIIIANFFGKRSGAKRGRSGRPRRMSMSMKKAG